MMSYVGTMHVRPSGEAGKGVKEKIDTPWHLDAPATDVAGISRSRPVHAHVFVSLPLPRFLPVL